MASLPDFSEFRRKTLSTWKLWFLDAATQVLAATPSDGVTIFFQSDIRVSGEWIDKAYLCQRAADEVGAKLHWHKIACRLEPGRVTPGRPAYSHVLCFGRGQGFLPAHHSADVIPAVGEKVWERGIGIEAALTIAQFVAEETPSKILINPFCGEGSMLAAANALGLRAIGIERSKIRAARALSLGVSLEARRWRKA